MNKKQVWISQKPNGGWRVYKYGDKRDVIHIDNKKEAINKARTIAKNHNNELKIQNKNGEILGDNLYGRNPFPPKKVNTK